MEGKTTATNKDKIIAYYEDYTSRAGEDNRATSSRSAGLEFHYTKKALGEHINNCTWLFRAKWSSMNLAQE